VHGYSPFRGLPELRIALAERYRDVYGVSPDGAFEEAVAYAETTGAAVVH
jgi:aspartate/methionine/tyrosine aminotransferase